MADTATTPLLTSHKAKPAKAPSIDDMIETYIGATGSRQLLKAILVGFAWAFDAQQVFISVFTDAEPGWHLVGDSSSSSASPCELPAGTWAWDRPAETSVVSEWALKCAGGGPALVSLPASSFFAGCLAGGFLLTTLADSVLGRKKTLLASLVSMSVVGALTALAPNVWAYAALRFVSGFARSMVGTCTLVLSTEIVGKRWRDTVSVAAFFCATFGFLSLPLLGYVFRMASWRNMYLWTSVPCLFYAVLLYLVAQESPRWLLVRGRKQDAIDTPRQIASLNGTIDEEEDAGKTSTAGGVFATLRTMWERRWALRRLAAIMAAGFGVGMVYTGMPLSVGSLQGSNLYTSVAYNALSELPSNILVWILITRINRRSSLVAVASSAGACSLACVAIPPSAAAVAAELLSFFGTCTAYSVVLIYSIELFPTSVRSSAVGLVRQAMVLGGVAAPVLVALGRERSSLWSFGVFGIVIGCSGLFAATCLPETRGRTMSDTMDEEEERHGINVASCTGEATKPKNGDRDLV
ncbi:hypothetical protein EJB05_37673, partial [Eragrostis curvula]